MSNKTVIDIGEPPQDSDSQKDQTNKVGSLSDFARKLTEPLSSKGWPRWLVFSMAILGLIYILNPTFGGFELIPDNIPLIGNLDEGVAFILILAGLVEFFEGKMHKLS